MSLAILKAQGNKPGHLGESEVLIPCSDEGRKEGFE
jgi:hypothetical protein